MNPLSDDSKFLESFAGIYKQLENIENSNSSKDLNFMPSFPLWNAEFSYLWEKNISECNENDVFDLFHMLKIQCSETVVNERKDWMNQ